MSSHSCEDCPITRNKLPKEAWAALEPMKPSYPGCVKVAKRNLCPMMQARDLQDQCRYVIGFAAGETARYAKRSVIGYFRVVLVSEAAKVADREQGQRAKTKRRGTGPQPVSKLFGGV